MSTLQIANIFNMCLCVLFVILYNTPYFRRMRQQKTDAKMQAEQLLAEREAAELRSAELARAQQLYDHIKAREEATKCPQ